jgi:DNA-binding MarR family transcriptional regulator
LETVLIEFVSTLDASLKKLEAAIGNEPGFSKLTIHQLHYIDAIHALGEPTITEIAEWLGITKASVTAGITKLAGLGYVIKRQSHADRRVFHVRLTGAGEQLILAKYQAIAEYVAFIRGALSEEEAGQLEHILAKLVKLFKQA